MITNSAHKRIKIRQQQNHGVKHSKPQYSAKLLVVDGGILDYYSQIKASKESLQ